MGPSVHVHPDVIEDRIVRVFEWGPIGAALAVLAYLWVGA